MLYKLLKKVNLLKWRIWIWRIRIKIIELHRYRCASSLYFQSEKKANKKRGNGKGGISRAQLFLGIELIEFTIERRTFAKL